MSTINGLVRGYMKSQEGINRGENIGIDTIYLIKNDTILPTVDTRSNSRNNSIRRNLNVLPPKLNH